VVLLYYYFSTVRLGCELEWSCSADKSGDIC